MASKLITLFWLVFLLRFISWQLFYHTSDKFSQCNEDLYHQLDPTVKQNMYNSYVFVSVAETALTDPFIFYYVYEMNLVKIMFVSGNKSNYIAKRKPVIF